MSAMKVGALFAGYGGIELALASVFDTEPAWFSEFDSAPSKILTHHWPDVPNLGDVTKIDWSAVEPVDIITGGSPCQDLSHAGKRKGMKAGTRSGLWASMCDAIDIIRPRLVIWENVRGAYSAAADSAVEPCSICVGDGRGTHLRALGRVLGDLSELGYDARWYGLRAADVGAAHGRFRVFVIAAPADTEDRRRSFRQPGRCEPELTGTAGSGVPAGLTTLFRTPTAQLAVNGGSQHPDKRKAGGHGPTLADEVEHLLPTPMTVNRTSSKAQTGRPTSGPSRGGASYGLEDVIEARLLPTPSVADAMGGHLSRSGDRSNELLLPGVAKEIANGNADPARAGEELRDMRDATGAEALQRQAGGPGRVPAPAVLQPELLEGEGIGAGELSPLAGPTGHAADVVRNVRDDGGSTRSPQGPRRDEQPTGEPRQPVQQLSSETPLAGGQGYTDAIDFGAYTAAVQRWEQVLGRPAPSPTEPGRNGAQRLSPRFCEWLMGLPAGWVTDVPGLSRNDQLKALGNGVVPAQAAAALRAYIRDEQEAAA